MFQSLKIFVGQTIALDILIQNLTVLRYSRADKALLEGQFSSRGGILDVYPLQFDAPLRVDFDNDKIRSIASLNILTGKSLWQHKIVIILPFKISSKAVFSAEIPLANFVEIQEGDYVVHNYHGIGRYLGIQAIPTFHSQRESRASATEGSAQPEVLRSQQMDVARQKKEHLVIQYEGGDKLFVPTHDMHLVQKYVGFNKRPPRLYKLGSKEWKRIRTLIQKRLQQLAAELLHMQAARTSLKGYAFSPDTDWQRQFEEGFPFEETADQIRATQEVKKDMESLYPMDRLLCGDVGYGKTEVALRAAFKAVMDNKQVVVLVPTTVLAEQHYYNFTRRLRNFPVHVAMLSRFRTRHEQAGAVQDLREGRMDIVIGTHRLLSQDIAVKDLGLIIIDEEQRFGVRSKERLKHLRLLADVLTLTATPIPRTLHMALTGVKDMSIIATPPQNRIPVKTEIVEFNEDFIQEAIRRELKRKGQVFFLHNRIEDIDQIARIIQRLVAGARLAVAHGRMSPRQLEEIMLRFLEGEIDVLVCTTIIESGIDIPNANTLIVNRAERFGLSDLHQLRGRVGRFTRKAYAYFIIPPKKQLSGQAIARIDAIERYCGLGAGFQIAFEDMQIRGAGNLLGKEQHGYISSVGFDLYCRLLKESVENLRKQISEEKHGNPN
jgi:transcription-repair coupling factor (superfamily II helicase)